MCLLASVGKWLLLYVSFQSVFSSDIKGRDKDRNRKKCKEIRESPEVMHYIHGERKHGRGERR